MLLQKQKQRSGEMVQWLRVLVECLPSLCENLSLRGLGREKGQKGRRERKERDSGDSSAAKNILHEDLSLNPH